MLETCKGVSTLGFEIGETYVNHRAFCQPPSSPGRLPHVPIQTRAGDSIGTTTRIVTHENEEVEERRGSRPAGTDLEYELASCWRRYFRLFTRSTMWLSQEMESLLHPGDEHLRHIVFRQARRKDSDESEASFYREVAWREYRGEPRSAAFLLRQPEIWAGGPGHIGIIGITGWTTYVWAYLLRTRMLDLLREPAFVMVELSMSPVPERGNPLHVDGWDARVILHHRI